MGSVTIFDSTRMKQIEDNTVVGGEVNAQNRLLLTKRNGTKVDAGSVASNAKMVAEDSATVDITVGGVGSDTDPFRVKADVKKIPAGSVDSGVFDLARIPDQTVIGTLDPTYLGYGPSKVKVGGVLSSTAYDWVTPYIPQASRRVRLLRTANTWVIVGQIQEETFHIDRSVLSSNWGVYAEWDSTNDTTFNMRCQARRLESGLVVLSGLLRVSGVPADNSVIFTLPPRMRPSQNLIHVVQYADQSKAISIFTDGRVVVRGNWSASSYLSIDGVSFWADGAVTWTDIGTGGSTFSPFFQQYPTTNPYWGKAQFYKDPYGFVWFQGLVQVVTTFTGDNVNICRLPSGHTSFLEQHYKTTGIEVHAGVGSHPEGSVAEGLNWKTGSPSTASNWISLTGVVITTPEAISKNPWRSISPGNGWVRTSLNFPDPRFLRREDGLAMSLGLLSSGTMSTRMVFGPEEVWPLGGRIIFANFSNAGHGRLDMGSKRDFEASVQPGGMVPRVGTNSWVSIDGLKWVP